ncbi:predicted protein [Sclerotinia sclerotiorum 1980 UF-70]|uniref:Uncharacterized protein n=1 Tax=Sclerotinia sclerotiorum (strain ATCC 18683 / 1980 / Ss-1) TaxID=665079 RepID=A7E5S0_SCLS1|nr:predicted protein [Sclerotinia sclerotiorum 1980 UF-70]EDN91242.1 predicted protein [Sclerotinia sclerotiorum 1980 UF-70]
MSQFLRSIYTLIRPSYRIVSTGLVVNIPQFKDQDSCVVSEPAIRRGFCVQSSGVVLPLRKQAKLPKIVL